MVSTILRNLLSNAIKFSLKRGEINILALNRENESQITVGDAGVGIPKDFLAKLFSLEENFTTRGTNNEKGTGLGLILCREFVERHKGEIRVESEENKGSSFHFTIPSP